MKQNIIKYSFQVDLTYDKILQCQFIYAANRTYWKHFKIFVGHIPNNICAPYPSLDK